MLFRRLFRTDRPTTPYTFRQLELLRNSASPRPSSFGPHHTPLWDRDVFKPGRNVFLQPNGRKRKAADLSSPSPKSADNPLDTPNSAVSDSNKLPKLAADADSELLKQLKETIRHRDLVLIELGPNPQARLAKINKVHLKTPSLQSIPQDSSSGQKTGSGADADFPMDCSFLPPPSIAAEVSQEVDCLVIGAGIAGSCTALEISAQHPDQLFMLVDAHTEPMRGTSGCNAGRVGMGAHTTDDPTARAYLKSGMQFLESFGDCMLPEDVPGSGTGIYFLHKGSKKTQRETSDTFNMLNQEYAKAMHAKHRQDRPHSPLIKPIRTTTLKDGVNTESIDAAWRVKEKIASLNLVRDKIKRHLDGHANIQQHFQQRVTAIEVNLDGSYKVSMQHQASKETTVICAKAICNCSGHNIEELNVRRQPPKRTLRLKGSITIKLDKLKHAMGADAYFFCYGPFASVSKQMGDDGSTQLVITAEEVTNVDMTQAVSIPRGESPSSVNWQQKLDSNNEAEINPQQQQFATELLSNAIGYFPYLKPILHSFRENNFKPLVSVNYGVVRSGQTEAKSVRELIHGKTGFERDKLGAKSTNVSTANWFYKVPALKLTSGPAVAVVTAMAYSANRKLMSLTASTFNQPTSPRGRFLMCVAANIVKSLTTPKQTDHCSSSMDTSAQATLPIHHM